MIKKDLFGGILRGTNDAHDVYAYTLMNQSHVCVTILNYGGIIKNIWVKDKNGDAADVVCGFDSTDAYLKSGGYQGALIGRIGNRIGDAKFTLEGKTYELYKNDGNNTLHGGKEGFDQKIWGAEMAGTDEEPALILRYTSPDMEENYPGTLHVKVTYTLLKEGALSIHYEAETDKTTIVNLTNHAYFNLGGYESGVVDNHKLWLDADKINSLTSELIPDGKLIDVEGTPYDFREPKLLGEGFAADHPMIKEFGGYDNNFCFADYDGSLKLRAVLEDTVSGRKMKCYTNQPCVQIYTANMINPEDPAFKRQIPQYRHCAVCLETQCMPDSINHEGFTNVILKPGEKYDTKTIYAFEN